MKIKLFSSSKGYVFAISKDNSKRVMTSLYCSRFVPGIKPFYQNSWQAYDSALSLTTNASYHLNAFEKQADYEAKPLDVSAEEMLSNHYLSLLRDMKLKSQDVEEDKDASEIVYGELKMIIDELGKIVEKIEDEKSKVSLEKIRSAFKKMKSHYFPGKQDDEEESPESQGVPIGESPVSLAPNALPQAPQDDPLAALKAKRFDIAKFVMASNGKTIPDDSLVEDVLRHYAENVCSVINLIHNHIIYKLDINGRRISICECRGQTDPILEVYINPLLLVSNILPIGYLSSMYPFHSVEFYQRYWKPIVEEVGHFLVEDWNIVLAPDHSSLPDIPNNCSKSHVLSGLDIGKIMPNSCVRKIMLSFRQGQDKTIWLFENAKEGKMVTAASKYTEEQYLNAIVKCIDPSLKSIYGRTGEVVQVIPHADFVEVDVDFGRGLDTVRLTENKIEIVPISKTASSIS